MRQDKDAAPSGEISGSDYIVSGSLATRGQSGKNFKSVRRPRFKLLPCVADSV
jgi:hypothetical protein